MSPKIRKPTELCERLHWILENNFGGRQAAMARKLDTDSSALSRILAGERRPSIELLIAIARLPNVSANWLLLGQGDPCTNREEPVLGCPIPIANQPLPGCPVDHRALLTREFFGVPAQVYQESRYFLRLGPDCELLSSESGRFVAGDLVLLETSGAFYASPDDVAGEVCVVRAAGLVVIRRVPPDHATALFARLEARQREPKSRRTIMRRSGRGGTVQKPTRRDAMAAVPDEIFAVAVEMVCPKV